MIKKILFYFPSFISLNIFFLYQKLLNKYQSIYFCQNDLDLKLMKHINKKNGRYLEVGAFDGLVGSVTLRLQNIWGWKGVLIEPIKSRFEKLSKFRGKKNICIHSACTENDKIKKLKLVNLGRMSFVDLKKHKIAINKDKHIQVAQELMIGKGYKEIVPNNTLTNILIKKNL